MSQQGLISGRNLLSFLFSLHTKFRLPVSLRRKGSVVKDSVRYAAAHALRGRRQKEGREEEREAKTSCEDGQEWVSDRRRGRWQKDPSPKGLGSPPSG